MSVTFHDVLAQLEAASLDSREKGDRFERLMVSYLKTDPAYAELYDEVWQWNDYPDRGSRVDTGIDLVAMDKSGEMTAIQCKFFAPTTYIQKPMIDGFLAASSKVEFAHRMIISTTDKWGKNAEEAIEDQSPPVARLRALDLSASPIDWAQFSIDAPDEMEKLPPKGVRPYQQEAIDDVLAGLAEADRGKLIMACGTGKTFTSLKLAEKMVPDGGTVLFLVPSISLLSQTVREWTAECQRPLRSFAVCSDVKVGKRKKSESEDISVTDLAFPATTDGTRLAQEFQQLLIENGGFTAVFSTYQSIGAVADAQAKGIPEFDLIICDEAHRTTGVTLAGDEESAFVRVHDQDFIQGKKRLYMTATPRIYGDAAQNKAVDAGATLADMGDRALFGKELHRLGFAKAVEEEILTDYKVLVLAVDEGEISRRFQGLLASGDNELGLEDAAKLVGCWNGLAKRGNDPDEFSVDPDPMRRAVAFAGNIRNSKSITTAFNQVVGDEGGGLSEGNDPLRVEVRHVDGTQNALIRNEALDWLREDSGEGECRILSNARCLSEGVDVPALDSVLFLAPRKSQVDVVQSVGRVMRKLEGKMYGYVILPIAIPADTDPETALNDNERYKVVWQVLQALRSHDERLNAIINKLDLTGNDTAGKISIIGVGGGDDGDQEHGTEAGKQLAMAFPHLDEWRDSIFARIVKRVGDRQYWDTWAKDIAKIAETYITRISDLIDGDTSIRAEFDIFLKGLRDNLNPQVDQRQAVEMLAQHLITRPVFDALFKGYSFSENNPVSVAMQGMLDILDIERFDKERVELESFYRSVRMRAEGIRDAAAKQEIVKDLYETFFRTAFKEMADRLGIVYTPIEIVDFILHSADEALQEHFGKGITDQAVHVLDPFTGTGTFLVRLIQSTLIRPDDLERKFRYELHANEIVLLAYYVAAINIEEAYHGRVGGAYLPFDGVVLTDSFQMYEADDQDELPGLERFPENNERVKRQKEQEIRVIVGNPPYSAGQTTGNDNNQNLKYAHLDKRIEETYAARSTATNKNSLYDSYIRAIRLATDRLGTHGVICLVSNGGFIDGNTADGLRKCLIDEFSQIYVFNLRGNQRTAGELSRMEGGKVFGSGSRATVAITLLIKNQDADGPGRLSYHAVADYLSREEKLTIVKEAKTFTGLELTAILPNEFGDWINQRDPSYATYPALGIKGAKARDALHVFINHSRGLETGRDAWAYNSSKEAVRANCQRMIENYNAEVVRWSRAPHDQAVEQFVNSDPTELSWSRSLRQLLKKEIHVEFSSDAVCEALYRPFTKQHVYYDRYMNHERSQMPSFFPTPEHPNLGFFVVSPGETAPFAVLMSDCIPDLHVIATGQFFPRYQYVTAAEGGGLFSEVSGNYQRTENISDAIQEEFSIAYGRDIEKEDLFFYTYGLLHSREYRSQFVSDLRRMLPRVPMAEDFERFADCGRRLSDLHVGYETVEPFPLAIEEPVLPDYRVVKMQFAGKGTNKDRSTIIYNDQITVSGIPQDAYRYSLGTRSAIEWVMERYQVRRDKASGIVNDPNDWAQERGDPRYILNLLGRVVAVSMRTMEIVDDLPAMKIIDSSR